MPMTVVVRGMKYSLQGPYDMIAEADKLKELPGVYVVHCSRADQYTRLDVGRTDAVWSAIMTHERRDCWLENCNGRVLVSAYYTESRREVFEQAIRSEFNLPCGGK